jgi:hypothetical protein
MSRSVLCLFCVAAAMTVIAGCGSSGGSPSGSPSGSTGGSAAGVSDVKTVAIANDEAYRGPLAAAVAPVQFPGASEGDRNWLQAEIARGLEESGAFATVFQLSARGQNNEADIVIDPTIVGVERYSGGLNRVDLRVRSQTKTTGQIGVDQVYRGKRSGSQSAIRDAVAALGQDLRRRYGG